MLEQPLIHNNFETLERAFVEDFLQPGMTAIDIGAHHGLYTLIAAKRVGPKGYVYAFEPSPRERQLLTQHIRLNRMRNVFVLNLALGNADGDTTLFLADGGESGCNSLRPPTVTAGTTLVRIHVTRLDDWLRQEGVAQVDFIKMDVEGGEMDLLKGAERCLERKPRPVILSEVQDIRTRPWGYPAREIIQHLARKGYSWYRFKEMGSLAELDLTSDTFDGNFVACPEEKTDLLSKLSGWRISN
jgi:FkbM family methyltransferase